MEQSLSALIQDQIQEKGPIRFYDFMEMSLYHPELGYYTSSQPRIGKEGDFYTSSSITPVFGYILGRQIEEMWALLDKKPFTIVEYGAGNGMLCRDILEYLSRNPEIFDHLRYCIIERSSGMRGYEEALLKAVPRFREKVSWHRSTETIGKVNGCVLSNELVDNFAVHPVVMDEQLMEVWVDYRDGEGFVEALRPASEDLKAYLDRLEIVLPKGFRTEINLEAENWIREIAAVLERGYVVTIDYGYTSEQLYADARRQGTLMCYDKHQVHDDYFAHIGGQDITAHVNFSALSESGHRQGLKTLGLLSQAVFLLKGGLEIFLEEERQKGGFDFRREAFIKQQFLVSSMADRYKVLIQQKGEIKWLPTFVCQEPAAPLFHLLGR